GYAFYQKGATSWKKVARKVDHALAREFNYVPLSFHAAPPRDSLQVLLGDSGFALEQFGRAARVNPKVKRILVRVNGPLERFAAIENRERLLCGAPQRYYEPMDLWRNRRERELSDQIIVSGRAVKELFIAANYPANKIYCLPLGIDVQP